MMTLTAKQADYREEMAAMPANQVVEIINALRPHAGALAAPPVCGRIESRIPLGKTFEALIEVDAWRQGDERGAVSLVWRKTGRPAAVVRYAMFDDGTGWVANDRAWWDEAIARRAPRELTDILDAWLDDVAGAIYDMIYR